MDVNEYLKCKKKKIDMAHVVPDFLADSHMVRQKSDSGVNWFLKIESIFLLSRA